jgi:hypothetical protein
MSGAVLHVRKRKEILKLEILFSSLREVLECSPLGLKAAKIYADKSVSL